MNPQIELNLALILFLPWFVILAVLFWLYPRAPRTRTRWWFDTSSLVLAVVAAALGTYWSYYTADPSWGRMWKQILASTISYGLFLLVMTTAFFLRGKCIASEVGPAAEPPNSPVPASRDTTS